MGFMDSEAAKILGEKYGTDSRQLSPYEMEEIKKKLNHPDTLPMESESTPAWLLRVSAWGKLTMTHKNPEDRINRVMSQEWFLEYADDKQRNEAYGKWNIKKIEINKLIYFREFVGIEGKKIKEEIIVDIDLRPDLKLKFKELKKKIGLFGWKLGF